MNKKHLVIAATIIVVVIGLLVVKHQANRFWFSSPANDLAPSVMISVEEGEGVASVAEKLADAGLASAFWFKVYARLDSDAVIYPGEHAVQEGSSYRDIINAMRWQQDVTITFPEGFTIAQMGERVVATFPHISLEEWERKTGQFSILESHPFIIAAGKPDDVDLEGYLFPDTYRFAKNVSDEEIVRTMIDTMEDRVTTVGLFSAVQGSDVANSPRQLETLHQALTLASIIEKEVRTPETMAMVADIFLKRLNIGMALQSDATVNYVTGGDDPSVSLADTDIDSLYNTYKYNGLTPGPISNPGLNALAAVAQPAANAYYYFLTTDEGDIYYAVTHDEHVANKARYLR